MSSPRPWGCFYSIPEKEVIQSVFPTPVGVFLVSYKDSATSLSLPHARGGVSSWDSSNSTRRLSSPRPWGCFHAGPLSRRSAIVFPTPVGVFLPALSSVAADSSLPHARGGVSIKARDIAQVVRSSPRPWGCFYWVLDACCRRDVFPTPVGVFPHAFGEHFINVSLPHARGGVSDTLVESDPFNSSSPRPWGCFPVVTAAPLKICVFPTPVGVFPVKMFRVAGFRRLPHARGGVSVLDEVDELIEAVFPTPVGVFPMLR